MTEARTCAVCDRLLDETQERYCSRACFYARPQRRRDERRDEHIRDRWGRANPRRIARALGVSRSQLYRRAKSLGLTAEARPWSEDEDELVQTQAGQWSWSTLGKRLGRSPEAVRARAYALGARAEDWRITLCATTVGQLVGRDPRTVARWIEWGWIRGRKDAGRYHVWPSDLRAFVQANPHRVSWQRAQGCIWELVNLLTGQWGGAVQ